MQAHEQEQLNIELASAWAADEEHLHSPAGKGKGVLSKVKHKARKFKNKMKKVAHSKTSAPNDEHKTKDQAEHMYLPHITSTHDDKNVDGDSTDDYDSAKEDEHHNDTQFKYEQLRSIGAFDEQAGTDGSEVDVHDGLPNVAHWKDVDNNTPISIYKSAGPPYALQATPTQYRDYAATLASQSRGRSSNDAQGNMKSRSDQQLDVANYPDPDHLVHDKIGVFSEDFHADEKLGVGCTPEKDRDNGEDGISIMHSNKPLGYESPTHTPVDGAQERMYRPVSDPNNLGPSLTSESINAKLYGDVNAKLYGDILAGKDGLKANKRGAQSGNDFPSDQTEEFSFDKESNLSKEQRDQTAELEAEYMGVEKNGKWRQEASSSEGRGKWSADKLNNAVDAGLALKLGSAGETGGRATLANANDDDRIVRKASEAEYYDPNDLQGNQFQEAFVSRRGGADEEGTFMDSTLAGSAAIVDKLHELKDTVASTLGYGTGAPTSNTYVESDEQSITQLSVKGSKARESSEEGDDQHQTGFLQGLKETMALSLGLGVAASPSKSSEEEPDDPRSLAGKDGKPEAGKAEEGEGVNLPHQWSLESASDVPQAAFL